MFNEEIHIDINKSCYHWIISLTEKEWKESKEIISVLGYNSDYQMYITLIDSLIKEYEQEEDYEKCKRLLEIKTINSNGL